MTAARRLAAILAADVVGYSRLMGEDEAGTAQERVSVWKSDRHHIVASDTSHRHGVGEPVCGSFE